MKPLTVAMKIKGWTAMKVAVRWGLSVRHMSNICNSPKQKDWDAVAGLPERSEDETG